MGGVFFLIEKLEFSDRLFQIILKIKLINNNNNNTKNDTNDILKNH